MKTLVATVMVLLASASGALAQDDDAKNEYRPHFTWNFRYPNVMSREQLSDESLMLTEGIARLTDFGLRQVGTEEEKAFARQKLTLLALGAMVPLAALMDNSEHEMGHLQILSRAGISGNRMAYFDSAGAAHAVRNRCDMIYNVMVRSSFGFGHASAGLDAAGQAEFNNNPKLVAHANEFNVMFAASGLNQEQYTSERLADRVLEGQSLLLDMPMWFASAFSAIRYTTGGPGNDIHEYVDNLEILGIHTNEGHVRNMHWARLVSGSSLAMYWGLWRHLKHCDTRISPLPVPFPEFASYMSVQGPTFKVRIPLRFYNYWDIPLLLEPSFQTAIDRGSYNEFGLKARYQLIEQIHVSLGAFGNSSGGAWTETEMLVRPWKWFEFDFGFNYGNGYTFERDIRGMTLPFLVGNEWSFKLGLALVLRF